MLGVAVVLPRRDGGVLPSADGTGRAAEAVDGQGSCGGGACCGEKVATESSISMSRVALQMSNPAMATIEQFVKRRKNVILEVMDSMKPAVGQVKRFFGLDFEPDTTSVKLLEGVRDYVDHGIQAHELNVQATLFGDVLKGAFDALALLKVGMFQIEYNSSSNHQPHIFLEYSQGQHPDGV